MRPFQISHNDVARSSTLEPTDIGKWAIINAGCYQLFASQEAAEEAIACLQTPEGYILALSLTPGVRIYYQAGARKGIVESLQDERPGYVQITFTSQDCIVVARRFRFKLVPAKRADANAYTFRSKSTDKVNGVSIT